MTSIFIFSAGVEFFSRGLLWGRVLLLGTMMMVEDYGFVLVLLGIEGLMAAVISYPSIKDVLVRQDVSIGIFKHLSTLFAFVAFPVSLAMIFWGDFDVNVVFAVVGAAYFNALAQVGLYALRVVDLCTHNAIKLIWSIVTSVVFLVGLSVHWGYLPAIYGIGFLVIAIGLFYSFRQTEIKAAFSPDRGYYVRGWAIYGLQALLNNFPQFGVRLFVASAMTLAHVTIYTVTYMIATALFFAFSAVMVVIEPKLSRAADRAEILDRLPLAIRVSGLFVLLSVIYGFLILIVMESGILREVFLENKDFDCWLLVMLMVFIAMNGVHTVVNCLVIAGGGRGISLLSTCIGAIGMFIGLIFTLPSPSLSGVGAATVLSQFVALLVICYFMIKLIHNHKIDENT